MLSAIPWVVGVAKARLPKLLCRYRCLSWNRQRGNSLALTADRDLYWIEVSHYAFIQRLHELSDIHYLKDNHDEFIL